MARSFCFFSHTRILSPSHLTRLQPLSLLHGFHVRKPIRTLQRTVLFIVHHPWASHPHHPYTGMESLHRTAQRSAYSPASKQALLFFCSSPVLEQEVDPDACVVGTVSLHAVGPQGPLVEWCNISRAGVETMNRLLPCVSNIIFPRRQDHKHIKVIQNNNKYLNQKKRQ